MIIITYLLFLCGLMHVYSSDNLRVMTPSEVTYQQKISHLDQQIIASDKQAEWKEFNKHYKSVERHEQYAKIQLTTASLMGRYYLSELATLVDPNYPGWQQKQLDTVTEGKTFSDNVHLFLLQDEYESKKAFLDHYKKSKVSCCVIQ